MSPVRAHFALKLTVWFQAPQEGRPPFLLWPLSRRSCPHNAIAASFWIGLDCKSPAEELLSPWKPHLYCPTSQRLQNPIPWGRVALESFLYAGDLLSSLFLIYRLDHLLAPWTSLFGTQDLHHHLTQPHPKVLPPHCPHFGKGPQSGDLRGPSHLPLWRCCSGWGPRTLPSAVWTPPCSPASLWWIFTCFCRAILFLLLPGGSPLSPE